MAQTDNLKSIKTGSKESAGIVEEEMNACGFNTGSQPYNGWTEESVYVYICPITPDSCETAD